MHSALGLNFIIKESAGKLLKDINIMNTIVHLTNWFDAQKHPVY